MEPPPGKRKPSLPPKPLKSQISGSGITENVGDSNRHRCNDNINDGDNTYEEIDIRYREENQGSAAGIVISRLNGEKQINPSQAAGNQARSPKPPLLPKPQNVSPKYFANSRPAAHKHSSPVKSVEGKASGAPIKNSNACCSSSVKRLHPGLSIQLKAPVARLEEFDSFSDTYKEIPVRPPRSPKTLTFKDSFLASETRPQLPLKNKLFSNNTSDVIYEASQSKWQMHKEKSASLNRCQAPAFSEARNKSFSLGRNRISDFIAFVAEEEGGASTVPVPPPRVKKKSAGETSPLQEQPSSLRVGLLRIPSVFEEGELTTSNVIPNHKPPIYAEVNYSQKKNRRQETKSVICESISSKIPEDENFKCKEEITDGLSFVEGKLILPRTKSDISLKNGRTHSSDSFGLEVERGEIGMLRSKSETEDNVSVTPESVNICDKEAETLHLGHVVNFSVIAQNRLPKSTVNVIITDNDTDIKDVQMPVDKCLNHKIHSLAQETLNSAASDIPVQTDISDFSCLAVNTHGEHSSCSPLPVIVQENCSISAQHSSSETHEDSVSSKSEWHSAKCSLNNSVSEVMNLLYVTTEESKSVSHQTVNSKVEVVTESGSSSSICCEKEVLNNNIRQVDDISEVSNETVETLKENSDLVCVKNNEKDTSVHIVSCADSNLDLSNEEESSCCAFSDNRNKIETKESCKFSKRRQSWSNYRDDSSPEKVTPYHCAMNRHKSKSRSWWCDEGELSSGALADLDSSDATRQSSLEEVDHANSDIDGESSPARNKITGWLGSFGKGRKHKSKRNSSQFYSEDEKTEKTGIGKNEINYHEENKCKDKLDVQDTIVTVIETLTNDSQDVVDEQVDGFINECAGSRPPSGLSALSTIDCDVDRKSEPPLSEESFEMEHHSESENETEEGLQDNFEERLSLEVSRQEVQAFYKAREMMTSERVFIDVLKLLTEDFRNAVELTSKNQKSPVIPETELSKILSNLPQLRALNEDLLRDLEHRIENWNSIKKIADVIIKKGPFLKLYTSYIQNFESQCNFLDECCQKFPRFSRVLKDFEASPRCQKLTVKHYMLKPVQRIPQYRLLLDDYLRRLSPDSPDFEDTCTALKIVGDVAEHANRSIKLGDHLRKLLQLQSQLGNYEIIKPGRLFIKDGELFKLSRKGRQPRYFILLNDCLLYTSYYGSGPSSGLKVNNELPLDGMKVTMPQAEDYHNEFSIISIKRSFTLAAQSLCERQSWVDALQKTICDYASRQLSFQNMKLPSDTTDKPSEVFKLGEEAPIWIQDQRVTMCQSCIAEFTVTFRRHHCRACGKVVCGDCSDYRAPLQYMKFQSARVCQDCYDKLSAEACNPNSKLHHAMKHALGNSVRIADTFKKLGPISGKKIKKYIPQRLKEVTANDTGSQISGWLQRRTRRSWKRHWFVLKEQVLYVYKASEDVVALESIPVLGYRVEPMKERHFELYEGIDARLVFQLTHRGQDPLIFHADTEHLANKWIAAMLEATVLK